MFAYSLLAATQNFGMHAWEHFSLLVNRCTLKLATHSKHQTYVCSLLANKCELGTLLTH